MGAVLKSKVKGLTLSAVVIPILASHIWIVLSYEPDAMCAPSDENVTEKTGPVWCWMGFMMAFPDLASHTWIVLSLEPDAMRAPSGENTTE
jgi:hypothetical protein